MADNEGNENLEDLDPDADEGDEGDDAGAGDGADGDAGAASDDKGEDKRIRDLQSRADKAEARANQLEKLLAKDKGTQSGSNDPERDALMTELREASLDAVYGEFGELREYGIDRALVEGTTRAEMRESATSLVALIKGVETKVRNKTLREHGIKADPAGSQRSTPKNYATMSEEDFEKELARSKSGGSSFWS